MKITLGLILIVPSVVAMQSDDSQAVLKDVLARKAGAEERVLKLRWWAATNGLADANKRELKAKSDEIKILGAQANKLIEETGSTAQDIRMLEAVRAHREALEKKAERKAAYSQNCHGCYTPDTDAIAQMRAEVELRKAQEKKLIARTTSEKQSNSRGK